MISNTILKLHIFELLLCAALFPFSNAQAYTQIYGLVGEVIICPDQPNQKGIANFSHPNCTKASPQAINPRNDLIWIKAVIHFDDSRPPQDDPQAIFLTSKMAADFYFNGQFVGNNGKPSKSKDSETPGTLDAVVYLPNHLLNQGKNELVIKASSHHDLLEKGNVIKFIDIRPYSNITADLLSYYSPALVLLGVFILGSLYFGITGLLNPLRRSERILSLICFFAAAQLIAEVYRGIVAYAYPIQDIRLSLVTLFAAGFGFSVAFYVLNTLKSTATLRIMTGMVLVSIVGVYWLDEFDHKSHAAIVIPLTICLTYTGVLIYKGVTRAKMFFAVLISFILAVSVFPLMFLDVIFYYLVAVFIFILFLEQGIALNQETKSRLKETIRADRLEQSLSHAQERESASQLTIKSSGKIERISTNQVVYCCGADGYTEIHCSDASQLLHNVTLADLAKELPSVFLRVHRSYLVNTAFVKSLKRQSNGTGCLVLTNESSVPVSRRIMPLVRSIIG